MRKLHALALLVGLVALTAPVKGDQCGFLLLGAGKCGASSSALLTNLIAYYALDEASGNATDAHTNAYHLTDTNTVTQAGTSVVGTARNFASASSEYFTHADNADFSSCDCDFSISAWVKQTTDATNQQVAARYSGTDLEWMIRFVPGSGLYRFLVASATGFTNVTQVDTAGGLSTGVWRHIVARHDSVNNTIDITLNGGTAVSAAYTFGSYNAAIPFTLAGPVDNEYLNGDLDEVGFWKRVITDTEVDCLYNSGSGRAYPFAGC